MNGRIDVVKLSVTAMTAIAAAMFVGCGGSSSSDYDAAGQGQNPPVATNQGEGGADQGGGEPEAPVETERVKAAPGVAKQGRSLDGYTSGIQGAMTSSARALFSAKQKIAYEIQVKHQLDLYKALNGQVPQTHEDFMRDIIKAYQVKLPELPSGHRYVFDPEKEELMVERPKQ